MNTNVRNTLIVIGIPTLYALALRVLFGIDSWNALFSVMSVTFLFLLPTIVGALTVYLSSVEKAKSMKYRIFMPWIPLFLFLAITLVIGIEGWACWLMILPVFLLTASLGGLLGGYLKTRKQNHRLNFSLLVLLPFLIGPLESAIDTIPGTYKAYTSIDIDAPAEKIWSLVTRVQEIPASQDKGYLTRMLGFPRPIKAELNFEGVGGYREAIFTKGLVFHETVTEYIPQQKMVFTIKAYPHEIPSTTLDEHVVIGGDYFDVLNGTYELEALPNGKQRLHLYSHFKMNTTFNFYAGWWGKWIMKDIQNNILQIEKKRAEAM
ncbi:SRPBCC family protein [Pustulibacterium marinum]|nr:SRPBCC family protein [Pustulibacterium marinum]